jgi:hypothetical protein
VSKVRLGLGKSDWVGKSDGRESQTRWAGKTGGEGVRISELCETRVMSVNVRL